MEMKNPVHPGKIIKSSYLDELGLTVGVVSEAMNISLLELARIIDGSQGVSALVAYRLSRVFGSTPRFWMNLQIQYDLAQAKEEGEAGEVKVLWKPKTEEELRKSVGD